MNNKIIQGDASEELKKLPDNSVDSIITDPPYGLVFMGKKWDNDVPGEDVWRECLRVLKPAGHLLSFGGTRTYHRMAYAIERAGFEIRDMVEWIYGSGFPKSHNIGKAVDKKLGNEREVVGKNPNSGNTENEDVLFKTSMGNNPEITKGNSKWEGWGTALKPAHEPIVLARKPIKTSVVENVLTWGTGGLNIDESRIGTDETIKVSGDKKHLQKWKEQDGRNEKDKEKIQNTPYEHNLGRFPANLIHDGSEEVLNEFAKAGISKSNPHYHDHNKTPSNIINQGTITKGKKFSNFNDSGTPARFFKQCEFTEEDSSFFYCPKAGKKERNYGCEEFEEKPAYDYGSIKETPGRHGKNTERKNNHPTVKPIKLMEYLIKLVTPKGGIVLDPFIGSGTTAIASAKQGMNFIGIEKEEEYVKIAEARIKPYLKQEALKDDR